MKPEGRSYQLLGVVRSKAKMYEYNIPSKYHIQIHQDPSMLFTISIGLLGDASARINYSDSTNIDCLDTNEIEQLVFSARFFDSYFQSRFSETLDPYLILLGSASYYLCGLPGSSSVLANITETTNQYPNLEGGGLEHLLLWLLQSNLDNGFQTQYGPYVKYINSIMHCYKTYYLNGDAEKTLKDTILSLRRFVYENGSPRHLLLGDIIAAIINKKIFNSAWKALPRYSGLPASVWHDVLKEKQFIRELWPAQHLLGMDGVFKGKSATIQMPTSAGKTKATELIIRSAFLSGRASLAVIVAPFRALCHEIKNSLSHSFSHESTRIDELSDSLQDDYSIDDLLGHHQILVVTPEKLLFLLRQSPELASHIGLIIFDEGHQFDSGIRGITYELLLTSLRSLIPDSSQKLLISAVISNAEAIGKWLNGNDNVAVTGTHLIPTFRSIGFVSWQNRLGRIEYVGDKDIEEHEYFVPRVIDRISLERKPLERKNRFFPDQDDGQTIAFYLGLKLITNGSIAIFCGRKSIAISMCDKFVDILERGLPFGSPTNFSDAQELKRLAYLHEHNFGSNAPISKATKYGVYFHHSNMPHGIRLALEHAMRCNLIRFVICTSTLAQGVNLPIRYLIITSVYQGKEKITVRDFHNLIGRVGRAGMHTEGSVLFADPIVYDKRNSYKDGWRWNLVKNLLDPKNTEECVSSLLQMIPVTIRNDRNKSTDKMNHELVEDILVFARNYISGGDSLNQSINDIVQKHEKYGFVYEIVNMQFETYCQTLSAIEGFILSSNSKCLSRDKNSEIIALAKQTLAYFLADKEKRSQIKDLFLLLYDNISTKMPEDNRRSIYGKTLYGVCDAEIIDKWIKCNINDISDIKDECQYVEAFWPLLVQYIKNNSFNKFSSKDVLKEITQKWVLGSPFHCLYKIAVSNKCKIGTGTKPRKIRVENIIDLCDNGLSYDGSLFVGAISQFIELYKGNGKEDILARLRLFQKRLKYGLPTETTIVLYEMGFSDRVIAQDLASTLRISETSKKDIVKKLIRNKKKANEVIDKYPEYFHERLNKLDQLS